MRARMRHRVTGGTGLPGWLIRPGASLDMDFANSRYFGRQLADLTVSRASAGYAQDAAGNWVSFGAGVPRITSRGLLVESARTNAVRNNTLVGAVGGTPGTLPTNWQVFAGGGLSRTTSVVTVAGVGVLRVRIFGTASATTGYAIYFDTPTGISASSGQAVAMSISAAISAGSLANISVARFNVLETTSAGAIVRTNYNVVNLGSGLTSSLTRYSGAVTLSGGATVAAIQPALEIGFNAGAGIDITFDLAWPQIELGAYATSPILTSGASVTRAADAVSLALSGVPAAYTLFSRVKENASAVDAACLEASDGSSVNRAAIFKSSASLRQIVTVSGANTLDTTTGVSWSSASRAAAMAIATNSVRSAAGGALVGSSDSAVAVPASGPSRLGIGSSGVGTSSFFEGYIEHIALIPRRVSNAELQSLTT